MDAGIFSGLVAPHLSRVNGEDNISVDHIIWTRILNTCTHADSDKVVDFALYVCELGWTYIVGAWHVRAIRQLVSYNKDRQ